MICDKCGRTMDETTIYANKDLSKFACSRCKDWRDTNQTSLEENEK